MTVDHSISRRSGDKLVVAQAQRQVQTFFDELKNGTQNYRTIASLDAQIAQTYRGRCILELLQNAHDALEQAPSDDLRQVSFVLRTAPQPVLLIGNTGAPFRPVDFTGLCQLGQSPKDPNQSVGNKGLGFRSVLEVAASPEIWSTPPIGSQTSFVFRFDPFRFRSSCSSGKATRREWAGCPVPVRSRPPSPGLVRRTAKSVPRSHDRFSA